MPKPSAAREPLGGGGAAGAEPRWSGPPIRRVALGEQVHEELLHRIHRGVLGPGDRLRDVTLAADLGVSRTPVREALLRLAREGVVDADLGRGFVVRPLSARQVREAYPVVWTLECLALRLSPPAPSARLDRLDRLNERLRSSRAPERRLELDGLWHELLLSGCVNETLHALLRALKDGLRRYELAYMREAGRVAVSTDHHARITAALRADDIEGAAHWLERNWRVSVEELTRWLGDAPAARGRGRRAPAGRRP